MIHDMIDDDGLFIEARPASRSNWSTKWDDDDDDVMQGEKCSVCCSSSQERCCCRSKNTGAYSEGELMMMPAVGGIISVVDGKMGKDGCQCGSLCAWQCEGMGESCGG